jgi:hypothetical protein
VEESLILIATKTLDIILFGPLIDRSDNLNASNILLNHVYSLSSLYSLAMPVDRFVSSLLNLFLSIAIKLLPSSSFHPVTIFMLQHFMAFNRKRYRYNYRPVFYMEIIFPTVSDLACEISLVKGF